MHRTFWMSYFIQHELNHGALCNLPHPGNVLGALRCRCFLVCFLVLHVLLVPPFLLRLPALLRRIVLPVLHVDEYYDTRSASQLRRLVAPYSNTFGCLVVKGLRGGSKIEGRGAGTTGNGRARREGGGEHEAKRKARGKVERGAKAVRNRPGGRGRIRKQLAVILKKKAYRTKSGQGMAGPRKPVSRSSHHGAGRSGKPFLTKNPRQELGPTCNAKCPCVWPQPILTDLFSWRNVVDGRFWR